MPKASKLSEGAVKLLQEKQIAQLATVMRDGSPQVTPVWIDVEPDGSHILINSAEGRIKTRNTAREPRVAVSVVDSQNPYRYAVIRGRIVERTHEGADAHIDRMAKKYLGQDIYPFRSANEQRLLVKIAPRRVSGMGLE